MTTRRIRVLLADDSEVVRKFLVHLLESDPEIWVIGTAVDGRAAVNFVSQHKPDVVVMDVHMPNLDGFEATRQIMMTNPVPIIICSATSDVKDVVTSFRAIEAGAIACLEKPFGRDQTEFELTSAHFLEAVKLMAEVKVVRRTPRRARPAESSMSTVGIDRRSPRIMGIGASTGGPTVLQRILGALPKEFSIPTLVVQHIAPGFLPGMVEWLNQSSSLQIQVAAHDTTPLPGHVYFAPDDFQMGLDRDCQIILTREELDSELRPSIAHLFRSLAEVCGPRAVGVLLTGMGRDGASELKLMKDCGAITLAQDRDSSLIHSLPGAAIAMGGATHVLPDNQIAHKLITLIGQPSDQLGL